MHRQRWAVLLRAMVVGAICGLAGAHAWAWGDAGHEIVALVAEPYLTPPVRRKLRALLARDDTGLAARDLPAQATWADKYRDSDRQTSKLRYERTRAWHYVNLALADGDLRRACSGDTPLPAGTAASDGPADACIVAKLDQFIAELRDPGTLPDTRLRALQFVLHLVGDLHQPLHASDDDDRGGNLKATSAAGFEPANLHRYWDTEFVRALGPLPRRVARQLRRQISAAQQQAWAGGSPAAWALESLAVARHEVYGPLPQPDAGGVYLLPPAYVAGATGTVSLQLRKAGVRLAWVLNNALE